MCFLSTAFVGGTRPAHVFVIGSFSGPRQSTHSEVYRSSGVEWSDRQGLTAAAAGSSDRAPATSSLRATTLRAVPVEMLMDSSAAAPDPKNLAITMLI